ncbi:hypothetical protein ACFX5Q_28305 [Mesorhizobium sp. IMUNJ 23033]|uniref:hypothetical protein n=1 Tax=Mesorhizobium sp. IMUNJ 23033 TaxID=3378039 RepID=UPI00384C02C3
MARPATAAVRLLTGEREPVRLATTGNIDVDTGGLLTIDGVVTEVGDRVLVKDQTDGSENGIRTASAGRWYRAADARTARTVQKGTTVRVQEGATWADRVFVFETLDPVIGDDALVIAADPIPLTTADILDEDDMASNSATKVPSQQSVKAYVDTATIVTQVLTGAVARPAIAKLKDGPVSLEDFGFVSGNALAAFNLALSSGAPIKLRKGKYQIDGLLNTVTNTPVSLEGHGPGMSILEFIGATSGITISQNDYTNPTFIRNLLLQTTQQEAGDALTVTYSKTDSITNRAVERCVIEDVWCWGGNVLASGWRKGIKCQDIFALSIVRPVVVGRKNNALSGVAVFKNMTAGIEIIGSDTPTLSAVPGNINVDNPHVSHSNVGFKSSGEVEGLFITKPVFVAVDIGIDINYTTKRPLVDIRGGHADVFTKGIGMVNAPQSFITGLCIYKSPLTHTDTYAIHLTGCDDTSVNDISAINQSQANDAAVDGEFIGVVFNSCDRFTCGNIRHQRPSKTVIVGGTTTGGKTSGLQPSGTYPNATVATYDDVSSGTNEYSGDNKPVSAMQNAGTVAVVGTLTAVTSMSSRAAYKGERYLVQGMIQATKGGTAGELITQLTKSGTYRCVWYRSSLTSLPRSPGDFSQCRPQCLRYIHGHRLRNAGLFPQRHIDRL